jgi:hypothetical protein
MLEPATEPTTALQPAAPQPALPKPPLPRQGKSFDRQQLVALQRAMANLGLDPAIPAHIRAQCVRAWSDLQERKRVMDGKPLPGQLRPDLDQVKQRRKRPAAPVLFSEGTGT